MDDITSKQIRAIILYKLERKGLWNHSKQSRSNYIPFQKCLGPIPKHLRGLAKKAKKDLVRKGWILEHKDNCVSLSLDFRQDIIDFIDKNL
ncbi:MAG: hypothetical protein GOU97_04150 [Nanoarchaeota archaeon]|nr:hypothetical protein [Nanoarchaeota archaeon]